jgi:signal transduction histidine kinase
MISSTSNSGPPGRDSSDPSDGRCMEPGDGRNPGPQGHRGPGPAEAQPLRGWLLTVLVALYVAAIAIAARVLFDAASTGTLLWYVGLLAAFFLLHSLVWIWRGTRLPTLHLICVAQCAAVLLALLLEPDYDYVTALYIVIGYQAAVVFSGRLRWVWIGALQVLIAGSLIVTRDPLEGLGLALTTMAFGIVVPGLAVVSQEIELAGAASSRMVDELEEANRLLGDSVARVEELAVLEERNRLARDLHDSVSQAMFGILLATRSAQLMRQKDPGALPAQIGQLQVLTQDALARMRGFILELRPKSEADKT